MATVPTSLWREPRVPAPAGVPWWDRVLVASLVPAAVVEGHWRDDVPWPAYSILLAAICPLALLGRRRHPLATRHRGRGRGSGRRRGRRAGTPVRPDVCLVDVRMPGLDGIEATRRLAGPDVQDPMAVVVVTTFDLDEYVHAALKSGARDFLLKDAGPEMLVQAVRAAAAGDALIAPSVTARLLTALPRSGGPPPAQPLEALTAREEEVLLTVARGRTNAEIARDLHVSMSTVKTHVGALMTKIGARNRVEIAIWAYESGRLPG